MRRKVPRNSMAETSTSWAAVIWLWTKQGHLKIRWNLRLPALNSSPDKHFWGLKRGLLEDKKGAEMAGAAKRVTQNIQKWVKSRNETRFWKKMGVRLNLTISKTTTTILPLKVHPKLFPLTKHLPKILPKMAKFLQQLPLLTNKSERSFERNI